MVLINLKIFVVVDKGKRFILFISIRDCLKSVQIRSSFSFAFSCTRTEYGDLLRKSQYSVQIQENMDEKKLFIWTLFTQPELELCDTNNQQSHQSVNVTLFFPCSLLISLKTSFSERSKGKLGRKKLKKSYKLC